MDGPHTGMQPGEDIEVMGMLVDGDEIEIGPVGQQGHQILADQPGRAGNDDLLLRQ